MELVTLLTFALLIGLFIAVYSTVITKGYGAGWAVVAVIISMAISPVIVFLICLYIVPDRPNHTWNKW